MEAIDERSLVTDSDISSMKNNTFSMQGTSLKLGAMAKQIKDSKKGGYQKLDETVPEADNSRLELLTQDQ